MKKILKKVVTFALVVLMGVEAVSITLPAQKAEAASAPVINLCDTVAFFTPGLKTHGFSLDNISSKATVTVTIADKTVASGEWDKKSSIVWFTGKKVGSTKVTITVKQGGKTYKSSAKLTWKKYTNPLKEFTIGTKAYKVSYLDKNSNAKLKTQTSKKAFKWKLKKGYKIEYIRYFHDNKCTDMKNGQSIKFGAKDKCGSILLSYRDPDGIYGYLWFDEGEKSGPLTY